MDILDEFFLGGAALTLGIMVFFLSGNESNLLGAVS
jgi:hypothetical protein